MRDAVEAPSCAAFACAEARQTTRVGATGRFWLADHRPLGLLLGENVTAAGLTTPSSTSKEKPIPTASSAARISIS
jgi:hypothetical protein